MNLVVDLGNTFVKAAVFDKNKMVQYKRFQKDDIISFENHIRQLDFDRSILSSVIHSPQSLLDYLQKESKVFIELGTDTKLPVNIHYDTLETLGKDRIALASGAAFIFPNEAVLVISAGSCITYDFVNENGEHEGGGISPGLEMRFRALSNFTDKLPHCELNTHLNEGPAKSTVGSIQAGTQLGIIYEIKGFVNYYEKLYKNLKVILCGGDTEYLAKKLKNATFAESNFLMSALNLILEFNA